MKCNRAAIAVLAIDSLDVEERGTVAINPYTAQEGMGGELNSSNGYCAVVYSGTLNLSRLPILRHRN